MLGRVFLFLIGALFGLVAGCVAWFWFADLIDRSVEEHYLYSELSYMEEQLSDLAILAELLARNDNDREAFELFAAQHGSNTFDNDGYVSTRLISVRFDGDRIVEICPGLHDDPSTERCLSAYGRTRAAAVRTE
ncbi:hypothetical protein L2D01_08940 [Hyphomonadaceae bacterium ML37]|nr:hypothetical protein L2D01_08940 [Hyphomonadaceae bacterium ML37]